MMWLTNHYDVTHELIYYQKIIRIHSKNIKNCIDFRWLFLKKTLFLPSFSSFCLKHLIDLLFYRSQKLWVCSLNLDKKIYIHIIKIGWWWLTIWEIIRNKKEKNRYSEKRLAWPHNLINFPVYSRRIIVLCEREKKFHIKNKN